jgi:hypothetical protein
MLRLQLTFAICVGAVVLMLVAYCIASKNHLIVVPSGWEIDWRFSACCALITWALSVLLLSLVTISDTFSLYFTSLAQPRQKYHGLATLCSIPQMLRLYRSSRAEPQQGASGWCDGPRRNPPLATPEALMRLLVEVTVLVILIACGLVLACGAFVLTVWCPPPTALSVNAPGASASTINGSHFSHSAMPTAAMAPPPPPPPPPASVQAPPLTAAAKVPHSPCSCLFDKAVHHNTTMALTACQGKLSVLEAHFKGLQEAALAKGDGQVRFHQGDMLLSISRPA